MWAHHQRRSFTLFATQSTVRSSNTRENETTTRPAEGSSLKVSVCCPNKMSLSWNNWKKKIQVRMNTVLQKRPTNNNAHQHCPRHLSSPSNTESACHGTRRATEKSLCNMTKGSVNRMHHLPQLGNTVSTIFQHWCIGSHFCIKYGVIFGFCFHDFRRK